MLSEEIRQKVLEFQRNEITEHLIYKNLSLKAKGKNAEILKTISEDELRHYNAWKKYTQTDVSPKRLSILKCILTSKILGLTFIMKMMEKGEENAEESYSKIADAIPEAETILKEEVEHEELLVNAIDEERIKYISSLVIGLNDALVELTGALSGLSLSFQNARLIGIAGLVTGIAASLSMSASEYLSQKSEKTGKSPLRASLYTGIGYIVTVLALTAPFFVASDYVIALAGTLLFAALIILSFSYFISMVKDFPFKRMFLEMLAVSLGIAAISFAIGWVIHGLFNIEI